MKAKLKPDKGIQDSEKMNKIRINKTVSMYYISWLGKSRRFNYTICILIKLQIKVITPISTSMFSINYENMPI